MVAQIKMYHMATEIIFKPVQQPWLFGRYLLIFCDSSNSLEQTPIVVEERLGLWDQRDLFALTLRLILICEVIWAELLCDKYSICSIPHNKQPKNKYPPSLP